MTDPAELGAETWTATVLLDRLGLFTTEVYQRSREEVIARQQQELLELSTPVVKLWEGVVAVPLIGTLDSARTQVVMENLLTRIVETGAQVAIIDITGVPTVDTLVAQHLIKTVAAARLMGAECIISGIRPQIAQTIVHLGVELENVTTKATLADAIAVALRGHGVRASPARGPEGAMERIPILKMGRVLLVTIQVDMHDRLALALQDDLTERIVKDGARGVLIDISSLEIVDSFIGRVLGNIAAMSRVLDAETVVVGMQPAVAITLVELGLSLPGVRTALNVERGMELLRAGDGRRARRCRGTMRVRKDESRPLRTEDDVVRARQAVRTWAVELGFSLVDQTKLVTAASELARNTVVYGGGGTLRMEVLEDGARTGLRLVVRGPGPRHPRHRARAARRLHHGRRPGAGAGRRPAAGERVRHRVARRARGRASRW